MEKLFSNVMVCKSCNQKYNLSKRKPMISVECLHKACKNCIESKFQKVQEGIICFQCEEITQPDKYKNDPEIQTILQDFSLLPICCDNHPNLSADFLCLDCEELVCNSCSQTHHDSHIINEQKISLEIFEEYLTNAAAMLDRHISPIQALLMEVRQLKENESEIKSSEFMQIYKKVTTFLCTQIFNQHELLKVDLKNYFMTENADANENGKKVLIRNHKHERKEQDLQTEMYKQNSCYFNDISISLIQQTLRLIKMINPCQQQLRWKITLTKASSCCIKVAEMDSQHKLFIRNVTIKDQLFGLSQVSMDKHLDSTPQFPSRVKLMVVSFLTKKPSSSNSPRDLFTNSIKTRNMLSTIRIIDYVIWDMEVIHITADCDKERSSKSQLGGTYQHSDCINLAGMSFFKVLEIEIYSFK